MALQDTSRRSRASFLWWQHGIVYQIYPLSFRDSNSDGKGDLNGIVRARHLSRATVRNIWQNLGFAFGYNALGIPLAAGVLVGIGGAFLLLRRRVRGRAYRTFAGPT